MKTILMQIALKYVPFGPFENNLVCCVEYATVHNLYNRGLVYWRMYASLGLNESHTTLEHGTAG